MTGLQDSKPAHLRYRHILYFVPFFGYIVNLLDYNRINPTSTKKILFTVLENTVLYFTAGLIAQTFLMVSTSVFFQVASAVWLAAAIIESVIIRLWGERFPKLGWGKLKSVPLKDFIFFMTFMYLQTMSFLITGFYVGGIYPL